MAEETAEPETAKDDEDEPGQEMEFVEREYERKIERRKADEPTIPERPEKPMMIGGVEVAEESLAFVYMSKHDAPKNGVY